MVSVCNFGFAAYRPTTATKMVEKRMPVPEEFKLEALDELWEQAGRLVERADAVVPTKEDEPCGVSGAKRAMPRYM